MTTPGADMSGADAQRAWLVRELRAQMRRAPKRAQLSTAADHAWALYEANVAGLAVDALACAPGCGGCCRSHVGVEMAEAFAILHHLQASLAPEVVAERLARTAAVAAQVAGMDPGARWLAQIPCVFLDPDTEACTIYDARPLACRGYTSTDRAACDTATARLDHDHPIPGDAERLLRSRLVRQALACVTARLLGQGDAADHAELHTALTTAAEAGSELAWLRKNREKKRG